jgi:hypothetical protein
MFFCRNFFKLVVLKNNSPYFTLTTKNPKRWSFILFLWFILGSSGPLSFVVSAAAMQSVDDKQPLMDVLQLMNKRGEKVIYSSTQVHSGMFVSRTIAEQLFDQPVKRINKQAAEHTSKPSSIQSSKVAVIGPKNQQKSQARFKLLQGLLLPFNLTLKKGPQNSVIIISKSVKKPTEIDNYNIKGQVSGLSTNQNIDNAKLTLLRRDTNNSLKSIASTYSNESGEFTFEKISAAVYLIRVEAQGYEFSETVIPIKDSYLAKSHLDNRQLKDKRVTLYLTTPSIERVVISASQYGISYTEISNEQFFDQQDIERMAHLTSDINRAVANLPGVAGGDISAQLYIRGGTAEENSFLFDGMPLFDPYHVKAAGRFFGIIDSFNIGEVQIITGGAPVEFGNHLSGVINITSNDWHEDEPWAVGINFLDVKAKASGRLGFGNENNNWFFSLRRGYLGAISATSTADFDAYKPEYTSGFGKVNIELSDNTLLTWHSLITQDSKTCMVACINGADDDSLTSYHWLTAQTLWLPGLSSNTLIGLGQLENNRNGYNYIEYGDEDVDERLGGGNDNGDINNDYRHGIVDASVDDQLNWRFQLLKQSWQYKVSPSQIIKAGFSVNIMSAAYDYKFFSKGYDLFKPITQQSLQKDYQTSLNLRSNNYSVYFADLFKVNSALTVEMGLRWDKQSYSLLNSVEQLDGNNFTRHEMQTSPRINFDYRTLSDSNFKFSWGRYHQAQGIYELAKEQPVVNKSKLLNPAQKVTQVNFSYQSQLTANLDYKVSLYNKDYLSVSPRYENIFGNNSYIYEAQPDRRLIAPQNAQVKGFEIVLQKNKEKKLNWWLAYSLSKAEEKINGHTQSRLWDQRHSISLSASYQFAQNCDVNVMGNYHTGWRDTPVYLYQREKKVDDNQPLLKLAQTYSEKHPNFIRVDMRIGCQKKLTNSRIRYFFEVLNLFGKNNISSLSEAELLYSVQGAIEGIERFDDRSVPFIPSLGFVWEF